MKIELRQYCIEDIPKLAMLANNYNVSKYLRDIFPYPYLESDATNFINHITSLPIERGIEFAITIDNQFVGAIGVTFEQDIYRYTGELGYWLGEPFWNQGIITKAIAMIVPYIFENFPIHKITAEVFSNNIGSQKALEKNGFILEGTLVEQIYKDNQFQDIKIYSLLNSK